MFTIFFNTNGICNLVTSMCLSEFLLSNKFYLFPLQILCPGEISQAYDIYAILSQCLTANVSYSEKTLRGIGT